MTLETKYCAKHPNTESNLQCGRCEKNVCPRCMVHAPVGIRCPECAQGTKIPTFDVSAAYTARGIGASVALGVGCGAIVSLIAILLPTPVPTIVSLMLAAAIAGTGYVVGEGVSRSVNRKKGRKLKLIATLGVLIAITIFAFIAPVGIRQSLGTIYWLAAGMGFWIAMKRF